jgi:hypothetical protein
METIEQAQTVGQDVSGQGEAQPQATQPELNITDLQNIRAIIDTAVRRGAFGAAEASSVGAVFDRLNTFLNAVAPPAQQPAPAQQPSAE